MSDDPQQPHWLYRRRNRPRLWAVQIAILLLALVPEWFLHRHAHFESAGISLDTSPGFFAWYGFLTCAAMVVLAKLLGLWLKRGERYYDE